MNDQPNEPFDELVRRALRAEADRIEPADGLHEIQARVREQRRPANRRPWLLTTGAAVVGTAAALGAFAVLDRDTGRAGEPEVAGPPGHTLTAPPPAGSPAPSAPATPQPTAAPTEGPTESTVPTGPEPKTTVSGKPEAAASRAVPVYWLGRTVGVDVAPGVRLYRTFARINGRPAYEALRVMTAGKVGDPDYQSPWQGAVVNDVTRGPDGVVTVDFQQPPRQTLEPGLAGMALQQLVYTVQGAMEVTAPVRLTVRGRPAATMFGVATKQPLGRAPSLDVQAFIWVETPLDGQVVSGPLKVSGIAAAHEAQLNWRLVNERTRAVVTEGIAQTKEAYKFTPFAFVVPKPAPGAYTLEVFESSVADGRETSTDTKSFVVR